MTKFIVISVGRSIVEKGREGGGGDIHTCMICSVKLLCMKSIAFQCKNVKLKSDFHALVIN